MTTPQQVPMVWTFNANRERINSFTRPLGLSFTSKGMEHRYERARPWLFSLCDQLLSLPRFRETDCLGDLPTIFSLRYDDPQRGRTIGIELPIDPNDFFDNQPALWGEVFHNCAIITSEYPESRQIIKDMLSLLRCAIPGLLVLQPVNSVGILSRSICLPSAHWIGSYHGTPSHSVPSVFGWEHAQNLLAAQQRENGMQ